MKDFAIFCDFDGTITEKDNIMNIMRKFAPPKWVTIKDDILAQKISIQDGVSRMFSLLPTSKKEDITSFVVNQAKIRAGFKEFISFTEAKEIPLYIISGGIDFFVMPILEKHVPFQKIFCNGASFSDEYIDILWPYRCDEMCNSKGCGCCKPSIIRKITDDEMFKIVIGDSITDLEAAKLADLVLARDFLEEKCEELQLPYVPFEDFYECREIIEICLEVNK